MVNRVMSWPRSAIDRTLRNRNRLPRFANRTIDYIADHPDSLLGRIAARSLGSSSTGDLPAPAVRPDAAAAVYIGPTNYAAQGWLWARAIDADPRDVRALNMAVDVPGGFSFTADIEVSVPVYNNSRVWQEAELAAVSTFSHVLYEAERALFGRLYSRDVAVESRVLAGRGLSTAFICHGADIRRPSTHVSLTPWSPFADDDTYLVKLERDAVRNRALLDELGRPTFVSTPDLLVDVPYATWCPVVIDPARWEGGVAVDERSRPVVVHVPSKSTVKGTHLIEPALRRLDEAGTIEYLTITGVPSARMPVVYGQADIVLDQFRLGSYGVAACEAMAAGRVVVGHVLDSVRDVVMEQTGRELPIVEATPDTLEDVLLGLIADPARRAALGRDGADFVRAVHDGRLSARVLLDGWVLA
ncbi:glycosyltransferase family 1 protein [Orlajensenia leifsoniae]|uniref:Glycosyltransferase family 1 protein n=1 Tax=Orlajensenia leifsoniae TaxID=2561933 RepID=A0A4Y9QQS2_9MICO|nr:glycosyltransferase family 1 protein [Leifsonia flava]TFV94944.1 glycosyltransferase family 1 protein [Leifsonia flava]